MPNAAWHQDYLGPARLFGRVQVRTVTWHGGTRTVAIPSAVFARRIEQARRSELAPGWIKVGTLVLPYLKEEEITA